MGNEVSNPKLKTDISLESSSNLQNEIQEILKKVKLLVQPMIQLYGKSYIQCFTTIPEYHLIPIPGKEGKIGGEVEWELLNEDLPEHQTILLRYSVFVIRGNELFIYGKDDFSGTITMTYRGKLVDDTFKKIEACTNLIGFHEMMKYQDIYSSGMEFDMSTECFLKKNGEWALMSRSSGFSRLVGWTGTLQDGSRIF